MHPTIHDELAKARAGDLYRRAERDTLARAARRARRARTQQGSHPVPRPPSASLACPRLHPAGRAQPALACAALVPATAS